MMQLDPSHILMCRNHAIYVTNKTKNIVWILLSFINYSYTIA